MRHPETFPCRAEDEDMFASRKKKNQRRDSRDPAPKLIPGTVCYVHPKGRYHTVAFETAGGVIRESFLGVER